MDMHLRALQSFCIRSLNTDTNNGLHSLTGLVVNIANFNQLVNAILNHNQLIHIIF